MARDRLNTTSGATHADTSSWAVDPLGAQLQPLAPAAHATLRVGAGLLFMQHGAQKLFGWLGGFGGTPGATADLFSQMGLAGGLEFFGGLLIVVGLFTRPVAVVLAGLMAAAWFIGHVPSGWVPILNGGELALLFMLIWTYMAAAGAGPFSVDALLRGRSGAVVGRPAQAHARVEAARRREVA